MKKLLKNTLTLAALLSTAIFTKAQEIESENQGRFDHEDAKVYEYHKENEKPIEKKNNKMFSRKDFGLYVGLNTFDKTLRVPELDQWKSRYVALQWRKNHQLITGKQVDVALGTGFEFAWNNFMYQDDIELLKDNNNVSDFYLLENSVEKAKLVVTNLNVPVMLQFGFKESDFRFGVGAYGGMRINSYQAFKGFDAGKERIKGDYNLRKFNYGLMAEAGKGDFRFFVKYDGLPLFNDNNPVNANAVSFGIRL